VSAEASAGLAAQSSQGGKRTYADTGVMVMVRYFYAWAPLVIVVTVPILALPWLGLIALTIVSLAAVAALAWLIVVVPYTLSQLISHRWQGRGVASPETAGLTPAERNGAQLAIKRPWTGEKR
jgi:hypothetical protein